jgi:hypothetical protein
MNDRINTLDELLADPMIQMVMARDRVHPEQVRMLLERARRPSANESAVPPAHVVAKNCLRQWLGS